MYNWKEAKTATLVAQSQQMSINRIKTIRAMYGLTQTTFAKLLDVSYHTYKNWEIGHRHPCTSAVSLLTLAEQNPKVFLKRQK